MLGRGDGCEQNYSAAADLFRQAASQGLVTAKMYLGILLCKGVGVDQVDYEQGYALLQEAIDGGSILALHQMGALFFNGLGVEQNTAVAFSYWQRAADQGDPEAARRVGYAYWTGSCGCNGSLQLAETYTKASAAQGDIEAIVNLKLMTACAQCGTGDAPSMCAGCKQVHYCNTECQLQHWRSPSNSHMAHCGAAGSNASPIAAKEKSDRPCASCGAHGAKMLCSDCLYEGDPKRKVR